MSSLPEAAIKGVAFDLDGLIFNTEDLFELAGIELLQRRGKQLTHELRTQMMGRRAEESMSIMIDLLGLSDTVESLFLELQQALYELLPAHLAPMPGLFELLEQIERAGLPKAVATSSPRFYLEDLLGRFDLLDRFAVTLAAEDVAQGKPHPEIYLKAAEMLNVEPTELLVLEDSETGTRAAAAASTVIVSVPHRHSRSQDFSSATYVAESLADAYILKLVDGSIR